MPAEAKMLYETSAAELSGLESDSDIETAGEFLAYLNPQHDRWSSAGSAPTWVFRGQGDATWALRPTVMRERAALTEFGVKIVGDDVDALDEALRTSLAHFGDGLDEAGITIPALPPVDELFLSDIRRPGVFKANEIPLMALARHHGVPTMLLDWTRRAYAAAYFAVTSRFAEEARRTSLSSRIAVWALDTSDAPFGERGRLGIRRAPGWTNPNMRAQSGVFTLLRAEPSDPSKNSVDGFCATEKARAPNPPRLRRITLTATECIDVLRRLTLEGVTGSSMFPGADGVVRSMRERALWDDAR